MNVFVDPDICIGCGLCCELCSAVFQMNDEGKSEAYQSVSAEDQGAVESAINSCPVSAIRWEE